MAITTEEFFETQHAPSLVKSGIAVDYFEPIDRDRFVSKANLNIEAVSKQVRAGEQEL